MLTDTLPAEVEFAQWVGDDRGAVAAAMRSPGPEWSARETITWTWQVTHTGGYGEVVTNTARYGYRATEEGDTAVFTVKGPPALIPSKEANPAAGVGHNDVVTYSITLTNLGDSDANGVLLTDTLPSQTVFAGWVEQNGAVEEGGVITWTGTVPAGVAGQMTWMWTITYAGSSYGETVTNFFTTTHPASAQTVYADAAFTTKAAPALAMTKTVSPDDVEQGSPVTYTVTLANSGESDAVGVTMTDVLPAEVAFGDWIVRNDAAVVGRYDHLEWDGAGRRFHRLVVVDDEHRGL